ncbi:NAD(P)-dependent oxidoreductase [Actinobacteria bacterium YIM 96077]|uniref:NAD(P)-dependent oxidoreductase n=1 Tax=Phytoactinopolyspora halophila TaxID=1981511 RepID=A0A329QZN0_9ACTN|nr:NAD(P)-dependent oxidoreductase [Phytoactinopolyspora halophila]AYY13188.1 NAD(P)-dependent oxidoreductase [Actinobacteria bacterium YIM 96077]RAW17573.1 NAD(P)-dependent oxidoreductase [Phytoactinopolyspora halophila]
MTAPEDGTHHARIAVVGTGRMGAAMAVRLHERGTDVAAVHNRTPAKAEAVAGRFDPQARPRVAATPREAAALADVVIVSLGDDDAVRGTYAGPEGLAAGLRDGSTVVETSTIDPRTVHELERMVEPGGGALLDAPVSGSVPLVEKGELTFLAGGSADPLERVRPVLDALARRVFHVGGTGTGAAMKLAVNAMVMGLNQVLSEALVLAEKAGVERGTAYEVFQASAVGAPFVHYKHDAFVHPDETPVAFSLDLVAKDLALITGLAERLGVRMQQTETNRHVARAAIEAGLGGQDMSAIAGFLTDGPGDRSGRAGD